MKKIFLSLIAVFTLTTLTSVAFAEGGADKLAERNAELHQSFKQ